MSVAEVEDAIAIEGLWEVRKRYGAGHQPDIERIAPPAPIQPIMMGAYGARLRSACQSFSTAKARTGEPDPPLNFSGTPKN